MTAPFWAAAVSREDGSAADGIHLLWTSPAAAGYSVTGYDIQRRASRWKPNLDCYTLTPTDLEVLHRVLRLSTPVAALAVRSTTCPRLPGDPPDDPFHDPTGDGGGHGTLTCVDFSALPARRRAPIDTIDGLRLTAYDARGTPQPHAVLRSMGGLRGVDCVYRLELGLPAPATRVVVTLASFAQPAKLTALAAGGGVVAVAVMHAPAKQPETITLSGAGIVRIRIEAPADETLLLKFCWETGQTTGDDCFSLDTLKMGQHPNPLSTPLATFTVFGPNQVRMPQASVKRMGALTGLDCGHQVRVTLTRLAARVRLTLVSFGQLAQVRALRVDGSVASLGTMRQHGRPETLTLNGPQIAALEIIAPSDETLLLELCVLGEARAGDTPPAITPRAVAHLAAAGETSAAGPMHLSMSAAGSSKPTCLRYDLRLDGSHQVVKVVAQVPAMLAIGLHQGKAVGSAFLTSANGVQTFELAGRAVDEVLLYTGQALRGLTICVDVAQSPDDEATEWSAVPYIAKGIQLPARSVNTALASAGDELALAQSRLIPGEALDATVFASVSATLNAAAGAGPAAPTRYTTRLRERLQDPFIELRSWPYALAMTLDAAWRRALGFGYLDPGKGLTPGARYDYRVTGHFLRRDLEEQLLAFHTIPSGTSLPATFHLGPVRFTSFATLEVELYPEVPDTALQGTSRKGIALPAASGLGGPSLTLGFDTAVTRVVLELEPALAGTLDYVGKTGASYFGLPDTSFPGTIAAAARVTLDFTQPIDRLELRGTGFLYGVRLPPPAAGAPDDILDRAVVLPAVQYAATAAPAPPPALGTTNLQQPIIPGDPAATAQVPPQAMGFHLQWTPPPPAGGAFAPWPADLGVVPPSEVAAFLLERRRVDTGGPFEPVGKQAPPTLYFGNRGARVDPPPLAFGIDALVAFPEVPPIAAPVDPWIAVDDVLLSAANPAGPPPGSTHQYRVFSVDAIGRRSAQPTTGSVVRLEKHIAPPRPPGPEATPPAGTVRPSGVRARLLQSTDPDLADDDIVTLGTSSNAIVLEWGWTADDRARDPLATEFRVYWQSRCPDLVRGTLLSPATLVGGSYQQACTLDQPVAADAMKGKYFLLPDYPFKVAGHDAGTSITLQLEPSALAPGRVPGPAEIAFTPILGGAELRSGGWEERTAVVAIGPGPGDPAPYVFRDRLTLDATRTSARVWVGVSSADAQSYIGDELPAAALNGGRPGNESSVAAVVVEGRYRGRPTFVVPPPLADVPEDVSPEPVGPTVSVAVDLPAQLPAVVIPPGCAVVLDRLAVGALASALSRLADGTVGVRFPDESSDSYTLGNPADQAALRAEIATGEPAQVENRFLMDALLRYPSQFEPLWQRALPVAIPFAAVSDTLPSKAERWLHRVRLSDQAGHVSEGAAIVPRLVRVASTRTPGAPTLAVPNSATDALAVTGRVKQAFDLKWLVLFTLTSPSTSSPDSRERDKAQLLRIPDRRDLYPTDGLRLRLADGTLLSPALAVDIAAAGTLEVPEVVVPATLSAGYGQRVAVWAVTLTRDGIPSRFTGPATAHTAAPPLVVPALAVTAAGGIDTASWPLVPVAAEISVERSTDGGASWTRVSPWLPPTATTHTIPGTGARHYRLALRGTLGQPTAVGTAVIPA